MSSLDIKGSRFTEDVVGAMRSLYPEELADKAWDNVGLLLGNTESKSSQTVLLTNDLTPGVADEAIEKKASVIVSYHPFIFRGLKSITVDDPQQRILLQLVQHNIAVYCPHTAVDAAPGGLNDWLADMLQFNSVTSSRSVAQATAKPPPTGFEGSGYGRVAKYDKPVRVRDIAKKVASGLGGLEYVMIAKPKGTELDALETDSVAVCAGSGWDVLKDSTAKVLVTGETSHHNALRAAMEGRVVITVFHSNSERRFLSERMAPKLQEKLPGAHVLVSEADEDPFEIVKVSEI